MIFEYKWGIYLFGCSRRIVDTNKCKIEVSVKLEKSGYLLDISVEIQVLIQSVYVIATQIKVVKVPRK